MIIVDLGDGYFAVPRDAVCLNCIVIPRISEAVEPHHGPWCIVLPQTGKAAENEWDRPFRYSTMDEVLEDVQRMKDFDRRYGTQRNIPAPEGVA